METIDIEDLVVWAYRTQAVEASLRGMRAAVGRLGPSAGGSGSFGALLTLGTRVDGGGAGLAALGADTHDDAIAVHDAVLRLPAVYVEVVDGDAFAVHWPDELARAGIRGDDRMGFDRDGVMLQLRREEPAVLVIQHGRSGARPEVMADFFADRSERPRDSMGRYIADRDAYRRTLVDVLWHRQTYAVWHAALVRLARVLGAPGRLGRWSPSGPDLSPTPWIRADRAAPLKSALEAGSSSPCRVGEIRRA